MLAWKVKSWKDLNLHKKLEVKFTVEKKIEIYGKIKWRQRSNQFSFFLIFSFVVIIL